MRNTILLVVFLLATAMVQSQFFQRQNVPDSLKTVIREIFELSMDGNVLEIDARYIHSEFGVYDVFRIGVPDTFERYSSIDFAFPTRKNSSMYPNLKELHKEFLIPAIVGYNAVFDCNEMVWDREGLFVTDSIAYPMLSEIIEQAVFEGSEFPQSFHKQVKHIEENSYRVVLTEYEIIFYLTKIDGRWYLTLFDRVTSDCSAQDHHSSIFQTPHSKF